MFCTTKHTAVAAFCLLCIGVGLIGCNVDGRWLQHRWRQGGQTSATSSPRLATANRAVDISIADAREVDLVEAVVSHRRQYRANLQQLHDYYGSHGYATRQEWAAFELKGLRMVKQSRYLLDAEVPSNALRPTDQIPEADALYEQGRELMRRGGHGVPGIYREDRMVEAANLLRELIELYPSSDKIDDAAFFCGEIHSRYLPAQELIGVQWYERAWTWNPDTPHPARSQAALVYDYRLHDRDRALELYRHVLEHETDNGRSVRFAARRITQLTGGTDRTSLVNRR